MTNQRSSRLCKDIFRSALSLSITSMCAVAPVQAALQEGAVPINRSQHFNIPAGTLADALSAYGAQSGIQIVYQPDFVAGQNTQGVRGQVEPEEALQRLLQGSGLRAERVGETTIVLRRGGSAMQPQIPVRKESRSPSVSGSGGRVKDMPEMLVKGTKSLNADIRRTMDDPQPYMVFDRDDIERSGAININDFLLKRVSSNNAHVSPSESGSLLGDVSSVNLRGLGTEQTLILIDGRRSAPTYRGANPGQVNLNGIPISAVERIEVLSTTASAIYGGSATGGVVNVVLRRDYTGGEISLSYDNSFDTDSSMSRIELMYGFNIGDRTSVRISGSYSEANAMLKRDRDFHRRGFERISRNDSTYLSLLHYASTSPNIISQNGSNLDLTDGTQLGSPVTYAPAGYLGPGSDGGAALIDRAGRLNFEPGRNSTYSNSGSSFGTSPRNKSLAASFHHEFSDRVNGFLDVSLMESESRQAEGINVRFSLPAGHVFNPFNQPVHVILPSDEFNSWATQKNRAERFSAGVTAQMGRGWVGSVDFTWSGSTNESFRDLAFVNYQAAMADGFNPFVDYYNLDGRPLRPYVIGSGNLEGPSSVYGYNPTLRFSGPLWVLPAGAVSASLLIEQNRTDYGPRTSTTFPGSSAERSVFYPGRSQDVRSAYAEISVPLFGGSNELVWVKSLDLQLAGRYDDYSTISGNSITLVPGTPAPLPVATESSVAEKTGLLGLKYSPMDGLILRASHGTGFVPPGITQLGAPSMRDALFATPDPRRGNTINPIQVVQVSGGNPNLGPERSKTTSLGTILEPAGLPGFRASLDYTWLSKTGNIAALTPALLLQYEDRFSDRILRAPNLPSDPAGWAGPITYFDSSFVNAATATYHLLDAQLKHEINFPRGWYLELWGSGTWTLKAEQQLLPGEPANNLRGISSASGASAALGFRGFYGAIVEVNGWSAGWTTRHYSSYKVADPDLASSARIIGAQGNGGRVPRQVLHDLWGRWRPVSASLAGVGRHVSRLEISGGIKNLLNAKPEVDLSNSFAFYSYLVDPRLRTYYLQMKYEF